MDVTTPSLHCRYTVVTNRLCYDVRMEDSNEPVAPANEPLTIVPTVVTPAGEDEIIEMLVEENRFKNEPELRAAASRLLEAGYTVNNVSRRLGIRSSTVWKWSTEPEISSAISAGREYRRQTLGQELENAAEKALSALLDVISDPGVNPKDRVKASEAVLDRCGLVSSDNPAGNAAAVAIDIDFDERLARIVAGTRTD